MSFASATWSSAMVAERKPGSNLGHDAIDWNAAFLYYAGLPPEQRSYRAVADAYAMSVRTVERHGRQDRWKQRARELDRDATERAGEKIRDKRVDDLLDTLKLIEAAVVTFATQLRNGTVKVTPADLGRLHKLRTEIWQMTDTRTSDWSAQAVPVDSIDPVERKLEVIRALDDAGVLQQLLHPDDYDHHSESDRPGGAAGDGEADEGGLT
jgi:hypothetical protein